MIPPRGCLVKPSRGKSPLVPSSSGGMDPPQKGRFGATSTSYPPAFRSWPRGPSLKKTAMGCLTYSRQLCLSREYIYILWLESAISTRFGKIRLLALVASQNSQDLATPGGSGLAFGRGLRSEYARSPGLREAPSVRCAAGGCLQWHIDVLELSARTNAAEPFRGLDNVVARLAGMFAAEGVGKSERLGQLTGSNNEARAVNVPCIFNLHKTSPLGEGFCELRVSDFVVTSSKVPSVALKFCGRSRPRGAGFLGAK